MANMTIQSGGGWETLGRVYCLHECKLLAGKGQGT